MLREEYLRRLLDAAYIDVYLSATDGARIYWPYRMMPVHEASMAYRNACEQFIIDSSFQHEEITNRDALDKAFKLDAEMAVLADVYQDKDATVEAIHDGLEVYDDHPFDGRIIAPLQAPHDQCYKEVECDAIEAVAIGGLKDAPERDRVAAARLVRNVAGGDITIHGLGWGVTETLARAIHDDPDMIDSVDYTTKDRGIGDDDLPGEERMSVNAARIGFRLIKDVRMVTPFVDPPTLPQSTFETHFTDL